MNRISPYPGIIQSFFIFIKQFFLFIKKPANLHKILLSFADNSSGDFVPILINPFDPMLLVKDVGLIHHILKDTEYQNRSGFPIIDYIYFQFIKELNILKGIRPKLTTNMGGITFANGEDWKRNRRIGMEVMNDSKFLENSIKPILTSTDDMIEALKSNDELAQPINKFISQLGIDIVGKLVFGTNLGMFGKETNGDIDSKNLTNSVRIMLDAIQNNIYSPFPAKYYSIVKTKRIKELDEAVSNLALTGTILLDKVKKEIQKKPEKNYKDCLAAIIYQNYPDLNDTDIQALLMDLLGAGHDTTANLVIFTLSLILEYNIPETSNELQNEIKSISKILPIYRKEDEKIDYRKILENIEHNSPVMNSILNESLRLFPLGAVFSRVSLGEKEYQIHSINKNYVLKPKAKLLISPYVTGRLKINWEDDSEKFNPNRFLDLKNKPKAFIPFGAGKRSCIGGRFGILEAKLILFRIFQLCKLQKENTFKPTDSVLAFTLRIKNDIRVKVISR